MRGNGWGPLTPMGTSVLREEGGRRGGGKRRGGRLLELGESLCARFVGIVWVGLWGMSERPTPLGAALLLERVSMQDIGYELPRTPLPGTWMNKARSFKASAAGNKCVVTLEKGGRANDGGDI